VRIDFPQGTLDLLILRTVAVEPRHGWAISERVTAAVGQVLRAV
jgi:PadR family transcriptional regulator PadR